MLTLLSLILGSVFVYTETADYTNKPRAVNLALETVIEFANKDRASDLKFIDQVQSFLNKVKYVLRKDQHYRRAGKPELKFSDFLRSTLAIINTYEDEDLEKFITSLDQEARKFNYRGCKFHELIKNTSFGQYIGEKLDDLKEMALEDVRNRIDVIQKMWNEGKLGKNKEQLIDFIDSLYEDDEAEKIAIVLNDLDLYRRDEKQRSSLDIFDIVRKGLRSLIFDHYSNLKARQRNDLILKLETAWIENPQEKIHHLFNSYEATKINKYVETEFETMTRKQGKHQNKKIGDKKMIQPRESNEDATIRAYDSNKSVDESTEVSKNLKKNTPSSPESEETNIKNNITKAKKMKTTKTDDEASIETYTTKIKKKRITATDDLPSEETLETTTGTKVKFFSTSLESEERLPTKKKLAKHSNNSKKRETIRLKHRKTTIAIQSSVEKTTRKPKHVKSKTSLEVTKPLDDENEVSPTLTAKKERNHNKEKKSTKKNHPERKPKAKKEKHSNTNKHRKKSSSTNSGLVSDHYVAIDANNTIKTEINMATVTVKHKRNSKNKTRRTHEPHHSVAFRNFELLNEDTSDTKSLRNKTDRTLATGVAKAVQESSDYVNTRKSRKFFTTLASIEGLSIESFEDHNNNVRKNNNDDSFHPKQEHVKEVIPEVLLNRLSQLEKELQDVKSKIIVAPETQAQLTTDSETTIQNPTLETLPFWKGTYKFENENKYTTNQTNKVAQKWKSLSNSFENENKQTTTKTNKTARNRKSTLNLSENENKERTTKINKTARKHKNKSSHIAEVNPDAKLFTENSADFKVITRNRSATTKSFLYHTSLLQNKITRRVTKSIKFDSPNFRASSSDNDKARNKNIFISVEMESPNATDALPEDLNLKNSKVAAQGKLNALSTVVNNIYEKALTTAETNTQATERNNIFENAPTTYGTNELATGGSNIFINTRIDYGKVNDDKALKSQQDFRRDMHELLKDENDYGDDEFDPDDLFNVTNRL